MQTIPFSISAFEAMLRVRFVYRGSVWTDQPREMTQADIGTIGLKL